MMVLETRQNTQASDILCGLFCLKVQSQMCVLKYVSVLVVGVSE